MVALLLAIAGVYGVMAYTVNQRVPEIGLRVALGASPSDVMQLVLREGALLVVIGLAVGAALSFAGARFISGLLFGVSARDPLVFAACRRSSRSRRWRVPDSRPTSAESGSAAGAAGGVNRITEH